MAYQLAYRMLFAVVVVYGLGASLAPARTWTSATGTFSVEADLVEARPDGTLLLKRSDGKRLEVKVEKLSQADQDFVKQQLAAPPKPIVPSEAMAPQSPQDEIPTEPDAAPAEPALLPVPDAKDVAKSVQEIRELLSAEYGKAKSVAEGQRALYEKLRQLADQSLANDRLAAYAMVLEAGRMAVDLGDAAEALGCEEWLQANFAISDGPARKADMLRRMKLDSRPVESATMAVPKLLSVIDELAEAGDYDTAQEIGRMAMRLARRSKDNALVTQVVARGKLLKEQKESSEALSEAQTTLKTKPQDPEANLAVGKYLCLTRGKWDTGLSHLAAGGDTDLAPVAQRDLLHPKSPTEQAELANLWWVLSESPKHRNAAAELQRRSAHWYQRALPGLRPLDKVLAEKRIEAAANPEPAVAGESPKVVGGRSIRTNSIGMKLVLIPAGKFKMGTLGGAAPEGPQHRVEIKRPFYMGIHVVTQAQYKRIIGNNPSAFRGDNLPVESMSWNDAMEFCRKLGAKESKKYRLPTEAEWEYACRAGSTTKFSFGDDESQLGEYAWYRENANGTPHPVGMKKPNAWGLYDMHGNILQRCLDPKRSYAMEDVADPKGAEVSGAPLAIRGSYSEGTARECRSAARAQGGEKTTGSKFVGFRVVCER